MQNRADLYFLLVFSTTVLLGFRFLGALLVGALIIIPAAIGRRLTHTLSSFLSAFALAGVVSVAGGLVINHYYPSLTIRTVTINPSTGVAAHHVRVMTDSKAPTIICVASFFKGNDFTRECKRLGAAVVLLTREKLLEVDWVRESLDDLIAIRGKTSVQSYLNRRDICRAATAGDARRCARRV